MADSWVSDVVPTETPAPAQAEWEQDLAEEIEANPAVMVTEKRQLILARRGQGKFRERVSRIEHACRITGVNRPEHLIASHCKPWRDWQSLRRMGIAPEERRNVGGFTEGQRKYLEFHRAAVFLEARVKGG